MVDNLAHVDAKLAARVAAPLGINAPDAKAAAGRLGFRDYRIAQTVDEDAARSRAGRPAADNLRTRKVAILVADGVDLLSFKRLQQELLDAGAQCKVVAPQLGPVTTSSGKQLPADHTFSNTSSIMFDAVVIPGGAASAATLAQLGDAVHFVLEAYKHCKTVCALNEGAQLLGTLGFALDTKDGALMEPTAGILLGDSRKAADGQIAQALIAAMAHHRHWDRLNVDAVPA
jgi:catalase